MASIETINEMLSYPFPDVAADYRYARLPERVEALKQRGFAVAGSLTFEGGAFFECAWLLRGLDGILMDFALRPEFAEALLDRIVELSAEVARRYAEAGVDMLYTGDDVGTQRGLMMSPDTYRRFLKPRLASVIAAARRVNPKVHVFYHSDGKIDPIIPDLIEAGVTVLNPVQPECMNPAELKRKYGDRLAFWGTVGTQTTMPFGTPADVRRVVKERIETIGKGGGLVIAPTQILEPDVPWENVVAFFEAVEEYG